MEYILNRTTIFNVQYLDLFIEMVGFGYLFFYVFLKLPYKLALNIGAFLFNLGRVDLRSYGQWAIITGCTDGIGKAYAEYIAKEGINLVLISRTLEKLNEQASELRDKFNIKTKVIAADFTEPDSIYPNIRAQIANLDIGILINNVGIGYKFIQLN